VVDSSLKFYNSPAIAPLNTEGIPLTNEDFFDLSDDPENPDNIQLNLDQIAAFVGGLRAFSGNDTVRGADSAEIMNGNAGLDRLFGGGGNDLLRGGRDGDEVFGELGNDVLNGNRGDDIVVGGEGNDIVRGGQDFDLLVGEAGNDVLIGDFGQDALVGGGDRDLFVLRTDTTDLNPFGTDIIIDFDPTQDTIGLTGGISAENLRFQAISVNLSSEIASLDPELLQKLLTVAGVSQAQLDPNGDGVLEGTLIQSLDSGTFLGAVLNTTADALTGHFAAVDENILLQG